MRRISPNPYFLLLMLLLRFPLFPKGEEEVVLRGSLSRYGDSGIIAGLSFPPFAREDQIAFTLSQMEKLSLDRIRITVDWRDREPAEGEFYWEPMDYRMEAARKSRISVFLTIPSLCPEWAALPPGRDGACLMDEDRLRNFIKALLIRYDNIAKIQFGNEWESGSEEGTTYTDPLSVEKFLTYTNILYRAVREYSPHTQVVLGGLTRTYPLVEYFARRGSYPDLSPLTLAKGVTVEELNLRVDRIREDYDRKGIRGNVEYVLARAEYDILDIHLYDDGENWPAYLSVLPRDKPILVSEFGGPNSEFESTEASYQALRMESYIDAIEQLPIMEAYYFKLVESDSSYHRDSGLFYRNYRIKPARNAFALRLTPE